MVKLKAKKLKGFKDKTRGLLFSKTAFPVFIETRFGIHTFGLKFPIGVLILDGANRVVGLKENLKPNRIFLWNPKYKKVIELPQGEIINKKIKIGDIIKVFY